MNNATNQGATLMAHCGTKKISREELKELPLPEATDTHQPLSHFELVSALVETLAFRYLKVKRDEYAVSADGMRMFGVMDLEYGFTGCSYSIGLRNSNDKSMRLALTAGYRVFVCDNMMFSGDFQPLLHKHTKSLNLLDALSVAVDRIHRNFEPMRETVNIWQETRLADGLAKIIIYDAFLGRKLVIPRFLLRSVHDYYFRPEHEAFRERNLWSLSNAFTSAFKKLGPMSQFAATAKLAAYLDPIAKRAQAAKVLDFPVIKDHWRGTAEAPESESQRLDQPATRPNSGPEDLAESYDPEEFADVFADEFERESSEEERIYEHYEDETFDDEEDQLTNEFMRMVA